MSGFVSVDPTAFIQMDRLKRKFGELLTADLVAIGAEAAARYMLNIFVRKEIPPYRHITLKQAYGQTFKSDKQRRYVMMMIRKGNIKIPYQRRSPRSGLSTMWFMEGSGSNLLLVNKAPYSPYVYGEEQSRLLAMGGWRKASAITEEYQKRATDAAARAISKRIKQIMQEDATE